MKFPRSLLLVGAAGPALFVIAFTFEGATRPGYSAYHNYVSSLSNGPGGLVQVANFVVDGALTILLALALRAWLPAGRPARVAAALIVVNGVALLAAGAFKTDPSLGYPPGEPTTQSATGMAHALAGLAAFLSIGIAPLVLARAFRADASWAGWRGYSIATGITVLVFFFACTIAGSLDEAGVWRPAPVGLLQRVSILSGNAWLVRLAWRTWRTRAP